MFHSAGAGDKLCNGHWLTRKVIKTQVCMTGTPLSQLTPWPNWAEPCEKNPESGHTTKILLEGGYGQFDVFFNP